MSSPEAIELAQAMRELWPIGWNPREDEIVATALDKFAAEAVTKERERLRRATGMEVHDSWIGIPKR